MTDTHAHLELPADFKGQVIRPGETGYDEGRAVINGMIDRRPALIIRPTGAADIIAAVNLARDNGMPVGIRCGAHSVAGNGVTDGGIQIDLSSLKGVRVDPGNKRAWANAGVLWGEYDRETQLHASPHRAGGSRPRASAASPQAAVTAGCHLSTD